jgi:hypothetical protein
MDNVTGAGSLQQQMNYQQKRLQKHKKMALQHVGDRSAQPPRTLAGSSITPQDLQYQEALAKRGGPSYPAPHDHPAGAPDRVNGTKESRH